MEYGLPGAGSDVEDGAVALLDVASTGDFGGGEMAAADEFGVRGFGFLQSGEMFFGDDEDVSRGLRADVFEGEDMLVFVDLLCWDLAADDAAEEAGCSWVSHKKNRARERNNSTGLEGMSAAGHDRGRTALDGQPRRRSRIFGLILTNYYQRKAGSRFPAAPGYYIAVRNLL